MTESFVWDYGTESQRVTSDHETMQILQEIHNEIVKDNRKLIYSHKVPGILELIPSWAFFFQRKEVKLL